MLTRLFLTMSVFLLISIQAAPTVAGNQDQEAPAKAMMEHYLAIQTTLAGDSLDQITMHALSIQELALQLNTEIAAGDFRVSDEDMSSYQQLMPVVAAAATRLAKAKNITDARTAFGELSEPMIQYRNMISGDRPSVAYCPMVKRSWLQDGKVVSNPYYGSSMLRCGSIVDK